MGSLMPGWDTHPNSTKIIKRSKSSLTKEEIEAYWRHKQQQMEALSKENNAQNANSLPSISETKLTTTTMVAPDGTTTQEVVINWPQPTASSRDWWTRSNWAYLNAPPEISDYPGQTRHRPYVPQHDLATQYNSFVCNDKRVAVMPSRGRLYLCLRVSLHSVKCSSIEELTRELRINNMGDDAQLEVQFNIVPVPVIGRL